MAKLQLTFAILKPHILSHPIALQCIKNEILTSNFKVVRSKCPYRITLKEAELFYAEHKQKFFYHRLITFMTSGPSALFILARQDAIKKWREMMGPTKVYRAQFEAPDTIRGRFGLSDTRNATHGSDSETSVRQEIGVFWPDFDMDRWMTEEEPIYRQNQLTFVSDRFLHVPKDISN